MFETGNKQLDFFFWPSEDGKLWEPPFALQSRLSLSLELSPLSVVLTSLSPSFCTMRIVVRACVCVCVLHCRAVCVWLVYYEELASKKL